MDQEFVLMQGALVKRRRTQLKLTQEELARRIGYASKSSINKIELGEKTIPQTKIPAFAAALDVPVSYFSGYFKDSNWDETFRDSYENEMNSANPADLAEVVDYGTLYDWEHNLYYGQITLDTACDIASTLGCSLDVMTGLRGKEESDEYYNFTEEEVGLLLAWRKAVKANDYEVLDNAAWSLRKYGMSMPQKNNTVQQDSPDNSGVAK